MPHMNTWSRLDRMYIMHNDSFLPEIIVDSLVAYGVVMSDHFSLIFEFSQCSMSSFSQITEIASKV